MELTFTEFMEKMQEHMTIMFESDNLFIVDVDKEKLWETYLESFPKGTNEIFRERREYDCS